MRPLWIGEKNMKRIAGCTVLVVVFCAACVSGPKFSSVADKNWQLVEARIRPNEIVFDRNVLLKEGFPDIFTLRFDAERVNGIGAPNRYFASYTLAANQSITIETVAGTLMAPLHEPEKLKEHDFFLYLQNTYKWNSTKNNLELYTRGEDGVETVLIFALEGKRK
jgi:heat shock protein HslJ